MPPDDDLLKSTKAENNQPYLIEKRVIVSGEDLTDAQPGFDQRTGEPIVIVPLQQQRRARASRR